MLCQPPEGAVRSSGLTYVSRSVPDLVGEVRPGGSAVGWEVWGRLGG